jgi:tetratricopeptide (TPR) repeat protein
MAIVLLDWDYLTRVVTSTFDEYTARVAEKCPGTPYRLFEHSVVFRLEPLPTAYSQARAYARQGQWAQSIAIYDEVLRDTPDLVRPYADRARAARQQGRWDAARADYDEALARMPAWPTLYVERSVVQWQQGHRDAALSDMGRFSAAVLAPVLPPAGDRSPVAAPAP